MNTFSELGLSKRLLDALDVAGFVEPTEIQSKTIAVAVAGNDVMGSAETGSGKTAAYVLPVLQRLSSARPGHAKAVVLVPTRELANQVKEQCERFGGNSNRFRAVSIYGGTGYERQIKLLKRGANVIIATPGRLFDLVERNVVSLADTTTLVLDEADRLLDMGFMPQVRRLVRLMPEERQTLMFSATIDARVEQLAQEFLTEPVTVRCASDRIEPAQIEQRILYVKESGKQELLMQLIAECAESSVLVFTKTRQKASEVTSALKGANVVAGEIHGDISQRQREITLKRFRSGEFNILVATDIAARGLDVPSIGHVINYDLPTCASDYVHRIGRTGRAGRSGVAHTFVSNSQRYLIRDIEQLLGRPLDPNAKPEDFAKGGHRAKNGKGKPRRHEQSAKPWHKGERNRSERGRSRHSDKPATASGGRFQLPPLSLDSDKLVV